MLLFGCGEFGVTTTTVAPTTTSSTATTTSTTTTTTTTTTLRDGGSGYWPHNDGNIWDYKVTNPDGSVSSETWTLNGTAELNNSKVAQKLLKDSTASYLLFESSSILEYDSLSDTHPYTLLSEPLSVGKKWYFDAGAVSSEAEVLSSGEVSVPAGTFDVYKVQITIMEVGATNYYTYWFSEDAGPVKYEYGLSIVAPPFTTDYTTYELTSKNF